MLFVLGECHGKLHLVRLQRHEVVRIDVRVLLPVHRRPDLDDHAQLDGILCPLLHLLHLSPHRNGVFP